MPCVARSLMCVQQCMNAGKRIYVFKLDREKVSFHLFKNFFSTRDLVYKFENYLPLWWTFSVFFFSFEVRGL